MLYGQWNASAPQRSQTTEGRKGPHLKNDLNELAHTDQIAQISSHLCDGARIANLYKPILSRISVLTVCERLRRQANSEMDMTEQFCCGRECARVTFE